MANDRLFIRCDTCKSWKMLLKHFPGKGPVTRDNGIIEWLDSHADCHPSLNKTDLGSSPGFSLHTEESPYLIPEKQNKQGPRNTGNNRRSFKIILYNCIKRLLYKGV